MILATFVFMRNITILTDADYQDIEHWATLRFSISQIATMLNVDVSELRLAIQNPHSAFARAYNSGKLKSSIKRREKLLEMAENGSIWAIETLDGYERNQREDELMP